MRLTKLAAMTFVALLGLRATAKEVGVSIVDFQTLQQMKPAVRRAYLLDLGFALDEYENSANLNLQPDDDGVGWLERLQMSMFPQAEAADKSEYDTYCHDGYTTYYDFRDGTCRIKLPKKYRYFNGDARIDCSPNGSCGYKASKNSTIPAALKNSINKFQHGGAADNDPETNPESTTQQVKKVPAKAPQRSIAQQKKSNAADDSGAEDKAAPKSNDSESLQKLSKTEPPKTAPTAEESTPPSPADPQGERAPNLKPITPGGDVPTFATIAPTAPAAPAPVTAAAPPTANPPPPAAPAAKNPSPFDDAMNGDAKSMLEQEKQEDPCNGIGQLHGDNCRIEISPKNLKRYPGMEKYCRESSDGKVKTMLCEYPKGMFGGKDQSAAKDKNDAKKKDEEKPAKEDSKIPDPPKAEAPHACTMKPQVCEKVTKDMRLKFYHGNPGCIYGGDVSHYRNNQPKIGNCAPVAEKVIGHHTFRCPNNRTVCNPLVFGVHKGSERPFCARRGPNSSYWCSRLSKNGGADVEKMMKSLGIEDDWNAFRKQILDICNDPVAGQLQCTECGILFKRLFDAEKKALGDGATCKREAPEKVVPTDEKTPAQPVNDAPAKGQKDSAPEKLPPGTYDI